MWLTRKNFVCSFCCWNNFITAFHYLGMSLLKIGKKHWKINQIKTVIMKIYWLNSIRPSIRPFVFIQCNWVEEEESFCEESIKEFLYKRKIFPEIFPGKFLHENKKKMVHLTSIFGKLFCIHQCTNKLYHHHHHNHGRSKHHHHHHHHHHRHHKSNGKINNHHNGDDNLIETIIINHQQQQQQQNQQQQNNHAVVGGDDNIDGIRKRTSSTSSISSSSSMSSLSSSTANNINSQSIIDADDVKIVSNGHHHGHGGHHGHSNRKLKFSTPKSEIKNNKKIHIDYHHLHHHQQRRSSLPFIFCSKVHHNHHSSDNNIGDTFM